MQKLISEELEEEVKHQLSQSKSAKLWDSFRTEILDGWLCLLIVIEVPSSLEFENIKTISKEMHEVLTPLMPKRHDDYTWVCGINQAGNSVDAVMGGWIGME